MATDNELLHGSLEVLILKTLSHGKNHGCGIRRWIEERAGDELRIHDGSLYPALYRLERKGLTKAQWKLSRTKRRARYYALTADGRAALKAHMSVWQSFARAVSSVLAAGT